MKWQDNSAIASLMAAPRGVFRGQLIGGEYDNSSSHGITLYNGQAAIRGGKTKTSNNLHSLVGVDDVGVFSMMCAAGSTNLKLQKSPLGLTDFTDVLLCPTSDFISARQFIDCGRHVINSTEQRLLLFVEYTAGGNANTSRVYYSMDATDASAGATWVDLFGAVCGAITHFHGGRYVKGKGLYLFTGDSGPNNSGCSILFCAEADIPNLIESPSTWYDAGGRWCLAANARNAWPVNHKSAYILGAGDQNWRVVDMTTNGRVAYFIPDRSAVDATYTSQHLLKVDLFDTTWSAAGTATTLATGLYNTGWLGGESMSGMCYFSTIPYRNAQNTGWVEMNNGFAEIYAINPDDDSWKVVKQIEVGFAVAGAWHGLSDCLFDFGGAMIGQLTRDRNRRSLSADLWKGDVFICGQVARQKKLNPVNAISGGSFHNGLTNWWPNALNVVNFSHGISQISNGNVVVGASSGATGTVTSVTVTSGSWAGDAAGRLTISNISGIWEWDENIKVAGESKAVCEGWSLGQVIIDPTGQIGGNVLRIAIKATSLTEAPNLILNPAAGLTSASKLALERGVATFSCKVFIAQESTVTKTSLQSHIEMNVNPMLYRTYHRGNIDEVKGEWRTWHVSALVAKGAAANDWYLRFEPNNYYAQNQLLIMYVTDFRLYRGAIPNEMIQQIAVASTGGGYRSRYEGRYSN